MIATTSFRWGAERVPERFFCFHWQSPFSALKDTKKAIRIVISLFVENG